MQLIGSVPLTLVIPAMDWRRFPELVQSYWFANRKNPGRQVTGTANVASETSELRRGKGRRGGRRGRGEHNRKLASQHPRLFGSGQGTTGTSTYTVTQVSLCSNSISIPAPLFGPRLPVKPRLSAAGGFQVRTQDAPDT